METSGVSSPPTPSQEDPSIPLPSFSSPPSLSPLPLLSLRNLGRLLRYDPLIYSPLFYATSICTLPEIPKVVPFPPLLVGIAVDMTTSAIGAATNPAALIPAVPAFVWYLCWVGRSLSFSSFPLSSSSSYSSPSTSAFVLPVVVPTEKEPVGEG